MQTIGEMLADTAKTLGVEPDEDWRRGWRKLLPFGWFHPLRVSNPFAAWEAVEWRAHGLNNGEIAAKVGVDPGTVATWFKHLGLDPFGRRRTPPPGFREDWLRGLSQTNLLWKYGTGSATVQSWGAQIDAEAPELEQEGLT